MTTHDDFEGHDGPICDTCECCEDCCECPDGPGAKTVLACTWGYVALLSVLTALGYVGFGSGWGFLAGLAIFGIANAVGGGDRHWALGLLAAFVLGSIVTTFTGDQFDASLLAGLALVPFGGCLFLGSWTLWVLWGLRRDRKEVEDDIAAEAAQGIDKLDAYLDGHQTIAAAATDEPRRFIGLSGYAGVGKDTVAAELMFNRDPEYTRVSFADPIRALALAINDDMAIKPGEFGYERFAVLDGAVVLVPLEKVLAGFDGDWTQAKKVPAVRKHLQGLGVGVRNVLGETTWVDTAMRDLPDGPIVVTDCRFPNEAQAIKDAGGYVVRIERPGVTAANAHITDTALDDWDFDGCVVNDSTPADARLQMRRIEELCYDPDLAPANT